MVRRERKEVTIADVAQRAGVAPSTVSRVLNGHSGTPETRGAVLAAVEALGFSPDSIARSLRSRETRTVGLQVIDIANPLFAAVTRGAERVLRQGGYTLLLANSDGDRAVERHLLTTLASRPVDGLLLSLGDESDTEVAAQVGALRVPVVLLDRNFAVPATDVALSDHRSGVRDAVRYLLDLGHRRIGFLGGPDTLRPGRERRRAFDEMMRERGVEPDPALVRTGSLSAAFGVRETAALLDLPEPPTALLAGGNQLGTGALETIRRRGLRIPDDLSLVICDDIDAARLNDPPITVVARDVEALGRAAAELLLETMTGRRPSGGGRVELGTHLVVRASCRRL
ncbi:MAG: substrate-binding domain-containing protein [Chloroflexi bacterium]|nr:substrate-binding domain-containing protein [Chloroflexota bacterium]